MNMDTFTESDLVEMLEKIRLFKNANKKHFNKDVRICPLCYDIYTDDDEWPSFCHCDNDE